MILTLQDIDPGINIHISTAGTAFNAESVHFYRDLGAKRVILPRHLTLEEIQAIVDKVNGIELEAFILNSRCANIDGFCTFQHGLAEFVKAPEKKKDSENACMMLYKITADVKGCDSPEQAESMLEKVSWERQHFWSAVHIDDRPCGACALYDFEQMGLAGVKIVGRANTFEKKIKDIKFLQGLLSYMHTQKPTQKEFREKAKETYKDLYDCLCLIFKCYYPSVMLDDNN
jgi:collagenase-like PrtC family protease